MSYGEFGCYLSHMKLYDYIIDHNIPYMFITEDDILPTTHIKDFAEYIKNLPSDFDICLFHHNPKMLLSEEEQKSFISKDQKINNYFLKVEVDENTKSAIFTQALSYIISYSGATKFLTRVKSNIHIPLDDQLARLGLNIIYSKEVFFYQKPEILKSSIWNIYQDNEHYDNVKWNKEIIKCPIKNTMINFTLTN